MTRSSARCVFAGLAAVSLALLPALPARGASGDPWFWMKEGLPGESFGTVLAGGDVNGDGYADLFVFATEGMERKVLGFAGGLDGLHDSPFWEASADLKSYFAGYVTVGDINGDGFEDLLVSDPRYDGPAGESGRVRIYLGSPAGLPSEPTWSLTSDDPAETFGGRVAPAGDVNADGIADLLVLINFPTASSSSGTRVALYLGSSSGPPEFSGWSAESTVSECFACSLGSAADVNGDGYDDVYLGSPGYQGGSWGKGKVELYLGSPGGLAPDPAWVHVGEPGQGFGRVVSSAGDANADGFADLIVGMPYERFGSVYAAGMAELFLGSPTGLGDEPVVRIGGTQEYARLGSSLAGDADLNGDGVPDFVVGEPGRSHDERGEGRILVFQGSAEGPGETPAWWAEGDLRVAHLGDLVATVGDVNGDGYADLAVHAPFYQEEPERVYVFYGAPDHHNPVAVCPEPAAWTCDCGGVGTADGVLDGSASFDRLDWPLTYEWSSTSCTFDDPASPFPVASCPPYDNDIRLTVSNGRLHDLCHATVQVEDRLPPVDPEPALVFESYEEGARTGVAAVPAGDVNGDGYNDVLVGAPAYESGEHAEGAAFLYLGSNDGLEPTAAWSVEGDQNYAQLGFAVAGAGDVNGDGYDDVMIAAPYFNTERYNEGVVYLFLGSADGLDAEPAWVHAGKYPYTTFGRSVGPAGDVNGDGYDDIVVGSPFANGFRGQAWVFPGSGDGLSSEPVWTMIGNRPGWILGTWFGDTVTGAGDVNGDGYDDILVTAPLETSEWLVDRGHAYVYPGSPSGPKDDPIWMDRGVQLEQEYGWGASAAGDVNGDGFDDIVIGSPWYDGGGNDTGRAYVYHGSSAGPSPEADWTADGESGFGIETSSADLNGDGLGDVLVEQLHGDVFSAFLGTPAGPAPHPGWILGSTLPNGLSAYHAKGGGDVNGDGYEDVLVIGIRGKDRPEGVPEWGLYVFYGRPTHHPPVASCPPPQVWECTGSRQASGTLDGSASYDPEGEPLTFAWTSESCALDDPTAAVTGVTCPLGAGTASLVVNDGALDSEPCVTQVEVRDTLPPEGGITAPAPGSCHGPLALPVVVEDDFADVCEPEITRTYDPEGGPSYDAHGDYRVTIAASDGSGNTASDSVPFTIDTVAPVVRILDPPDGTVLGPGSLPMTLVFAATDDDGAAGGVVHEVVRLDDCAIYDGWTYGDGDGLLSDETIRLDTAELCRVARLCGFDVLRQPVLRVEAEDCGGNVGADSRTFPGSLALVPGLCSP